MINEIPQDVDLHDYDYSEISIKEICIDLSSLNRKIEKLTAQIELLKNVQKTAQFAEQVMQHSHQMQKHDASILELAAKIIERNKPRRPD